VYYQHYSHNPKYGTIPSTRKKINSIPDETRTVGYQLEIKTGTSLARRKCCSPAYEHVSSGNFVLLFLWTHLYNIAPAQLLPPRRKKLFLQPEKHFTPYRPVPDS